MWAVDHLYLPAQLAKTQYATMLNVFQIFASLPCQCLSSPPWRCVHRRRGISACPVLCWAWYTYGSILVEAVVFGNHALHDVRQAGFTGCE